MSDDYDDYESRSLRKAKEFVANLGLPLPEKPRGEWIDWPDNVADLQLEELSRHMGWWKAWAGYCAYYLAEEESNKEALDDQYKNEHDRRILGVDDKQYKNVTMLKAAVGQLPELVKIKQRASVVRAKVKLMSSLLLGYADKYEVISREVSRRKLDRC